MKIDIIKLNHWLNARKITTSIIKKKRPTLAKKIKLNKNFLINKSDIKFFDKILNIDTKNLELKQSLPKYLYSSKKEIISTKRPIFRDGIHFYNYYTLPSPTGFKCPVILDILCPNNKIPKLNNGHLEQAITVNLGPGNIYGRWDKNIKLKDNFSIIKSNSSNKNSWIVGDTYLEPTYLPHSYSLYDETPSQILSYTSYSQLERFVINSNVWPEISYKNFLQNVQKLGQIKGFIKLVMNSKGVNDVYLSKKTGLNIRKIKNFFNKNRKNKFNSKLYNNILTKICKILNVDENIFKKKEFKEDSTGKNYLSIKDSIKSIRKYKSYLVASMSSSLRYPDLSGLFIKVSNQRKVEDLIYCYSSHYLATSGEMKFKIQNKTIKFNKGDSIWISPFIEHGIYGLGSVIKISNGESLDYRDIYEINKIFDADRILKKIHKDKGNWGYSN